MRNAKAPAQAAAIARQLAEQLDRLAAEPDIDTLAPAWATWCELEAAMQPEALAGLREPANGR
jgi:hypothetical protein